MKKRCAGRWFAGALALFAMLLMLAAGAAAEAEGQTTVVDATSNASVKPPALLKNGSFEEDQTFTSDFQAVDQKNVPGWSTTATDGKIELFRKNSSTYLKDPNVTLEPSDGTYGAELNANQASTLYQVLKTEPFSIYEWGLAHGSRTTRDVMALIIGPNQSDENSKQLLTKSGSSGKDQFMQMVEWLKVQTDIEPSVEAFLTSDITVEQESGYKGSIYNDGQPIVVYSKKFGSGGTFVNGTADNAFSLTPSSIHTEQWHIWLMKDARSMVANDTNPWGKYGSHAGTAGTSKYYEYTVPAGQEYSLFGFVSVANDETQNLSYGNFLDDNEFKLYYRLSASTTKFGSATIAVNGTNKYVVEVDGPVKDYVSAGDKLTLKATIDRDALEDAVFAGVYCKYGDGTAEFIANVDPDGEEGTENNPWVAVEDVAGQYTHTLAKAVESSVDLHFVFVKSPMIIYDANGGDPYDCDETTTNETLPENVYSFEPKTVGNELTRIGPYTSRAATKTIEKVIDGKPTKVDNPGWRFVGWMLTDDNGNQLLLTDNGISTTLPHEEDSGKHKVACNHDLNSSGTGIKKQQFLVIGKDDDFIEKKDSDDKVLSWSADTAKLLYDKKAAGLTFVARWRWRQTYMPKLRGEGGTYTLNADCGSIEVYVMQTAENETKPTKVRVTTESPAENSTDKISQCYFAELQETMVVEAKAKDGFEFEGWYDTNGNLVSTKSTLSYIIGKEDVKVYEARFSGSVLQKFIRQIKDSEGNWVEVPENKAGVPTLTRDIISTTIGSPMDCMVKDDADAYALEGWYEKDEHGQYKKITSQKTLSYTVTGAATYYARFVPRVRFEARFKDSSGNVLPEFPVENEAAGSVNPKEAATIPGESISSTAKASTGYQFAGWYNSIEVVDETTRLTGENKLPLTMPTEPATYYAIFTAGESSYQVKHIIIRPATEDKPNGEEEVYSSETIDNVETGKEVSANPIEIPGYSFQNSVTVGETTYVSIRAGKVRGDGKLELKLYYVQNSRLNVHITNVHKPDTIGMVIRKEWDDAGNRNRPGSIQVQIRNAKTDEVVASGTLSDPDWTWNVPGLYKRQDRGETVRYIVEEVGVNKGYSALCDVRIEEDGSYTVKLTNVLTGKLDIGGTKHWDDNGDRDGLRPDEVYFRIYQDAIEEANLVRIVRVPGQENADDWGWTVQDLPMYDVNNNPITYIVVEETVPYYTNPGPRFITVQQSVQAENGNE